MSFPVLDVRSGSYDLAYQLSYDDAPTPLAYEVSDFSLAGQPLTISSSTDGVIGWRKKAVNAFLNTTELSWSNEDSFFPSSFQPAEAFLKWESEYVHTYSKIVLRCPTGTAYAGTASLYSVSNGGETLVESVSVQKDSTGQFFEFAPSGTVTSTTWVVRFSNPKVSVQSVTVSGILTLLSSFSTPTLRSVLVMYPEGTSPKTVKNSLDEDVPVTYCIIARVDTDDTSTVTDLEDKRSIINSDYTPVAEWLTTPFDEDLIDLYDQVSEYSLVWMNPQVAMKQEYENLTKKQVTVEV